MNKGLVLVGAYVVCGFLTYGHLYNRDLRECWSRPHSGNEPVEYQKRAECYLASTGAVERTFFSGAFWPIYWAGRGAIFVTK